MASLRSVPPAADEPAIEFVADQELPPRLSQVAQMAETMPTEGDQQQQVLASQPTDQARPQLARAAFTPASLSMPVSSPSAPLTNHEIYELIQKSQQQQVAGNQSTGSSRGSFKQPKRRPLYSQRHSELERQSSIIVGTPGFRERYGKWIEIESHRANRQNGQARPQANEIKLTTSSLALSRSEAPFTPS